MVKGAGIWDYGAWRMGMVRRVMSRRDVELVLCCSMVADDEVSVDRGAFGFWRGWCGAGGCPVTARLLLRQSPLSRRPFHFVDATMRAILTHHSRYGRVRVAQEEVG